MISICIPVYAMGGRGVEMLQELTDSIQLQAYTDYEIVISNDDGRGAAANLNRALDNAKGNIIKPMFQDDKFIEPDSLQKIADALQYGIRWVACTSDNQGWGDNWTAANWTHVPYQHKSLERLRQGENTYGSPSAMAWERNELRMDENLAWLFDCEFYSRMAERFGTPKFVDTPIYIRQWNGMATQTIATGSQRIADSNYVIEKYREVIPKYRDA